MAGRITVSTLNNDTGVLATQNGMTGIAKAWVNFDGTTGTIRSSFNVSSITYNSVCDYTVNMTTAMSNINYSYCVNFSPLYAQYYSMGASINSQGNTTITEQAPTTTTFRFITYFLTAGATTSNAKYVNVMVFGT